MGIVRLKILDMLGLVLFVVLLRNGDILQRVDFSTMVS